MVRIDVYDNVYLDVDGDYACCVDYSSVFVDTHYLTDVYHDYNK